MKQKIYGSIIIGLFMAVAILIRPQIARMTGPNSQWTLEPTESFPNGIMAAGDGFAINANMLDGYSQSAFQRKVVTKTANFGSATTTSLSGSSDTLSGATVSFSSEEITGDTKLIVLWTGSFNNNTVSNGVQTRLYLDGSYTGYATHIVQANPSESWEQHTGNAVLSVESGSHTVNLKWNQFYSGGTAAVTDNGVLTVIAIPE